MGTPIRHRRPDILTLLTRILAETSRLTEHGGSARALRRSRGNGPGAETSLSVSRARATVEVDCQWQVRVTVVACGL